jgi:L-alanine-DL-glutamate epimerase-like enolase superfamily enzyme
MKVTAVESILLTVPYRTSGGVQAIAGRPSAGLNMLLIRLDTDGGVTGWGEAFGHGVCPASKTAFDTLVAPMLIGRDPSGIDALTGDLARTLHLFGRSGAVMYALSGVDIALWDIAGKVAGKPLYEMFGGDARPARSLREPVALLGAGCGRAKLHRGAGGRLPADQAARDHGASREGGA